MTKISRERFLRLSAAVTAALVVGSCSKTPQEAEDSLKKTTNWLDNMADALGSTETTVATKIQTPTPEGATITPKPSNTPEIPTPSFDLEDNENLQKIRETNSGEIISLKKLKVSYVVKIPRPLVPDAVYAVGAIEKNGEEKGVVIIENFDCGLENLQKANKLGDPLGSDKTPAVSGLWKPNTRFDEIGGKMFVEASVGTIAVVTGTSYRLDENEAAIECPKNSIFKGAGDLPEKLAREAGKIIRDVIEGFKEGYFEEN